MHTTTIEFDEIVDDRFGGKALGLAELTRLGYAVPTGFVIGASFPVSTSGRRDRPLRPDAGNR